MLEFCLRKAVQKKQIRFKETKLRKLHLKNVNKSAFLGLKQNRLHQAIKHKDEHKAELSHRSSLLRKAVGALRSYRQTTKNKQLQKGQVSNYYESIILMKAFEALRHFVFVLRKAKKVKNYKSIRLWARMTKSKVLNSLKAYKEVRQQKKRKYAQVVLERNTEIKKQVLFKMLRVGQYWVRKHRHFERSKLEDRSVIDLRRAFFKLWANCAAVHSPSHLMKSERRARKNDS